MPSHLCNWVFARLPRGVLNPSYAVSYLPMQCPSHGDFWSSVGSSTPHYCPFAPVRSLPICDFHNGNSSIFSCLMVFRSCPVPTGWGSAVGWEARDPEGRISQLTSKHAGWGRGVGEWERETRQEGRNDSKNDTPIDVYQWQKQMSTDQAVPLCSPVWLPKTTCEAILKCINTNTYPI